VGRRYAPGIDGTLSLRWWPGRSEPPVLPPRKPPAPAR
jgi:hypothetical protein